MGVVYEAIQLSLNRKVALKVLPWGITSTDKDVARFRREAEAAANLHHTNIVPIYAQGEHVGTYYYAMQYIEGRSLDKVITDAGGQAFRLPAEDRRTVLADSRSHLSAEPLILGVEVGVAEAVGEHYELDETADIPVPHMGQQIAQIVTHRATLMNSSPRTTLPL